MFYFTSRYNHCRCTVNHNSVTSRTCDISRSHLSTSLANGLINRDALNVDNDT